jgi:hypothetical protein
LAAVNSKFEAKNHSIGFRYWTGHFFSGFATTRRVLEITYLAMGEGQQCASSKY